jgi:hypothetical protein
VALSDAGIASAGEGIASEDGAEVGGINMSGAGEGEKPSCGVLNSSLTTTIISSESVATSGSEMVVADEERSKEGGSPLSTLSTESLSATVLSSACANVGDVSADVGASVIATASRGTFMALLCIGLIL